MALNFQTAGMEMDLNDGLFTQNGCSGYILKPEILCKKESLFNPENPEEHEDYHPLQFSVKVLNMFPLQVILRFHLLILSVFISFSRLSVDNSSLN